jgi:acyl dehydratase
MNGLQGSGRWFDELREGDSFSNAVTVTETHLVLGAGLIGDFNPHHTNAEYAKRTRFGTPILHGMMTSALMGAAVGMYFHGTAVAYLEHRARFIAPVRAGDTLTSRWAVTSLVAKPAHRGGIVVLAGKATIQDGSEVAEAEAKVLVGTRAL